MEMEVQGSRWSARKRTVIARMENYVNKSDRLKLEIEELELLMGPKDSEVNLRVSQRGVQDCNNKGDLCWTEACEGIARRMLKYLDYRDSQHKRIGGTCLVSKRIKNQCCAHCEACKKSQRKSLFQILRQGENEVLARRDGMNN